MYNTCKVIDHKFNYKITIDVRLWDEIKERQKNKEFKPLLSELIRLVIKMGRLWRLVVDMLIIKMTLIVSCIVQWQRKKWN